MIDPAARIESTADLEPGVTVGPRTTIWRRAQVREGARIGADVTVGRDAFIDADVVIGDRVKIQNGALVYHGATVEDGVFIGPAAIITNDRYPRAITSAGEVARAGDWDVAPVMLRYGSSIGAGAVIVGGVEIGRFAMVGAGGVVTRDVPAHALVAGSPAHRIGWVCACGFRLSDANGDPAPAAPAAYSANTGLSCTRCGRVYRYLAEDETLEERTGPREVAPA